jgi:hypothetical protein
MMAATTNSAYMAITAGVLTVFSLAAKTIVSDFAPIGKTIAKIRVHPC